MRCRIRLLPIGVPAGIGASVAVVLAVPLVLGGLLSGCAGSVDNNPTTSSGGAVTTTSLAPTTSTAAETTSTTVIKLGWGATGKWQGVSVKAASPQTDPSPQLVGDGNKVVYCMVTITNNSAAAFDYNGLDFILLDTAHLEYNNPGLSSAPDIGNGTLAVGESVSGAVAFELPQAVTPSGLEWQPQSAAGPVLIWGEP